MRKRVDRAWHPQYLVGAENKRAASCCDINRSHEGVIVSLCPDWVFTLCLVFIKEVDSCQRAHGCEGEWLLFCFHMIWIHENGAKAPRISCLMVFYLVFKENIFFKGSNPCFLFKWAQRGPWTSETFSCVSTFMIVTLGVMLAHLKIWMVWCVFCCLQRPEILFYRLDS